MDKRLLGCWDANVSVDGVLRLKKNNLKGARYVFFACGIKTALGWTHGS
jgi:hypothetical protein